MPGDEERKLSEEVRRLSDKDGWLSDEDRGLSGKGRDLSDEVRGLGDRDGKLSEKVCGLSEEDRKLAIRYAPRLWFDRNEPFFPARFGVTVLREDGDSPSFRRSLTVNRPGVAAIVEYAIYYDYDIQHLYDLEHVWVYIGRNGEVADVEASFHGKYLKGLLRGSANLSGTRASLYVQPGKHALSPISEVFELLPAFASCTQEEAGADGLIYGDFFRGILATDEETDQRVRRYLQTCRFTPALSYLEWGYGDREDLFVSWSQLFAEIPGRIRRELDRL